MIQLALVVASVALLNGSSAGAPSLRASAVLDTSSNFSWSGSVPKGAWLRIRDLAGTIEVKRATGSTIEIRATPEPETNGWSWDHARIEPVRFVTRRIGSDVTVCAITDDMPRCDPDNISHNTGWNGDWRPQAMHVVVQLPAGVAIQTETMHGDLEIADVGTDVIAQTAHGGISIRNATGPVTANSGHGDVDITDAVSRVTASTGHGDIHVSGASAVRATTGHGNVIVELATAPTTGGGDMMFETAHGNVRVAVPRTFSGDVDLYTGHGHVSSDFPLRPVDPDAGGNSDSERGTLGTGGRIVRLSSGHGDVSLTTED